MNLLLERMTTMMMDKMMMACFSDIGNDEEIRSSRLQRRLLTKQRIVNSIDAAVNLENYNPFPIPHELRTIESVFKVDNKKQNDIKRTFQNQPATGNVGRNNRANVITGRQGPQPKATNTPSPRAAFELYFTNELGIVYQQKN